MYDKATLLQLMHLFSRLKIIIELVINMSSGFSGAVEAPASSETCTQGVALLQSCVEAISSIVGNNARDYFKILIGFWYMPMLHCSNMYTCLLQVCLHT